MGLSSRTLWTLRRYWADRLGVPPEAFEKSGGTVGDAEEGGIQLFSHGDSLIVGVPGPLLDAAEDRSETGIPLDADDEDAVHGWLTRFDGIERAIGPTFYGYADRETFTPVESDARALTAADAAAYRSFQRSIPDTEWEQGGTQFTPGETVGLFVDEELVAVAGFDVWEGVLAHLAVVTRPDNRGRGYGRSVVSQATEKAFADGLLPQYRTSDAWPWSVALAQDLGFHRFATAYLGVYRR
ncbi:GNAT family N-acetyltransferase [Halorubrum sp. Atlit-26R]|uniref:GNAT family N-acetyltransferase n=1 Tax=Halorubrum sp. Atlit-26R TaxID=2282128 RepID=UPI000EF1FF0F|nr:GNAT family N-acetyltransferase [Halorubrum sp. Atlit-26R]RLM63728.1 GNAT family N-acetyltransferase [Halorubrum sp. Atlit-26R]